MACAVRASAAFAHAYSPCVRVSSQRYVVPSDSNFNANRFFVKPQYSVCGNENAILGET